jgi:hypothetical protein
MQYGIEDYIPSPLVPVIPYSSVVDPHPHWEYGSGSSGANYQQNKKVKNSSFVELDVHF